ncbi:MAG: carboxylating nicotinate-nucleotide diphosphorylase [Candidatus Brocadiales bacterium]|nr:carboxylating nicotinate-nucleotide diphosphorylase [Candidatus Bathyanammoxibius amoris]
MELPVNPQEKEIQALIDAAISEDIGGGDVTTDSLIPEWLEAKGEFIIREPGVVAGLPIAREVYKKLDAEVSFEYLVADGAMLLPGRAVASVKGPARAILFGERVVLNFLQRLSGIATLTVRYVERIKGHKAKIYDTRKTTPGWRTLEKYAVKMGGGMNHRMGLYDQVLIKDNHLKILEEGQALTKAVREARQKAPQWMLIEVETGSLEEVEEAVAARPDIIMLDNMSVEDISRAIEIIRSRGGEESAIVEVSGGVTLENVAEIAGAGPDWISVGALTHSASGLDIALEIKGRV